MEKITNEGVEDVTGSYMEIAMEFARVNISPMAPPNSGPRDLAKKTWGSSYLYSSQLDVM